MKLVQKAHGHDQRLRRAIHQDDYLSLQQEGSGPVRTLGEYALGKHGKWMVFQELFQRANAQQVVASNVFEPLANARKAYGRYRLLQV